ncbi:26S proteasome non-ATPase regulatory subunit 12 [Mitosporidium daphniae]
MEKIEDIIRQSNILFEVGLILFTSQSENISSAIAYLLVAEKHARQNELASESALITNHIMSLCLNSGDFELYKSTLTTLCKKRGQLKQTITSLVQLALEQHLTLERDNGRRESLIEVLREITDGRVFVEAERAKLALLLARIYEADKKDVQGAARILNEIQIETFGSLNLQSKLEFLLEQMRLTLEIGDTTTVQILSKKMAPRAFDEHEALRARYYDLLACCSLRQGEYLACARALKMILESAVSNSELQERYPLSGLLEKIICFVVLAPYSPEQQDLLLSMSNDERAQQLSIPLFSILTLFKEELLIPSSSTTQRYGADLQRVAGSKAVAGLKERIMDHNLRIISIYYKRISLVRLSQLLMPDGEFLMAMYLPSTSYSFESLSDTSLSAPSISSIESPLALSKPSGFTQLELAERQLSSVIARGILAPNIEAKIDRISGVVSFERASTSAALASWVDGTGKMLKDVVHLSQLIAKEEAVRQGVHTVSQ